MVATYSEKFVNWDTGQPLAIIDATSSVFRPSGTNHSVGLVPDPGAVAGSTKFLREDGVWANASSGLFSFVQTPYATQDVLSTYVIDVFQPDGVTQEFGIGSDATYVYLQSYSKSIYTKFLNESTKWIINRTFSTNGSLAPSLVDIAEFYDATYPDAAGGGHMLELNMLVGYNAPASGSPGAIGVSTLVQDCRQPSGGGSNFSEPFGLIMLVQANRTATNAYDHVNYWGFDSTINGPVGAAAGVREGYLSGLNICMSKYAPGNTIDSSHFGSIGISMNNVPFGGANAGDRSGYGLTGYQLKWGIAITGYSGPNDTTTDGHSGTATSAYEYALQIGGRAGAWMTDRDSKYDTGIYILDHLVYAIDLGARHPDNTGEAMYIRSTAGSVGIWTAPDTSGNMPLLVGKSVNGEINARVANTNAGSSAVAKWSMAADSSDGYLMTTSSAAGDYSELYTSGAYQRYSVVTGSYHLWTVNAIEKMRLSVSSSDTLLALTTPATTAVKATWLSGSGTTWTLFTQDDYVSNKFVVRGASTDYFYFHTDGFYLVQTGAKIDFASGAVTITNATADSLVVAGGQITFAATTTAYASCNFPQGTAPTSPVDGDVWREDNTNTGYKIRVNGTTKTITLS